MAPPTTPPKESKSEPQSPKTHLPAGTMPVYQQEPQTKIKLELDSKTIIRHEFIDRPKEKEKGQTNKSYRVHVGGLADHERFQPISPCGKSPPHAHCSQFGESQFRLSEESIRHLAYDHSHIKRQAGRRKLSKPLIGRDHSTHHGKGG